MNEARDIVEQLRIEISEDRLGAPIDVMKAAVDEIERLRKEARILARCQECVISPTLPQARDNYAKGAIWYNSGTGKLERVWDGQAWVELT